MFPLMCSSVENTPSPNPQDRPAPNKKTELEAKKELVAKFFTKGNLHDMKRQAAEPSGQPEQAMTVQV
jgi:hypothetical protein